MRRARTIKLEIREAGAGGDRCVVLGDRRIAGTRGAEAGRVAAEWDANVRDIRAALDLPEGSLL
jgi:hypothetical protein